MTVRQSVTPRPLDPAAERIQREHELNRALEAARTLQERLELLGDRASDVAVVVSLRISLVRDLVDVGTVVVEPTNTGPLPPTVTNVLGTGER